METAFKKGFWAGLATALFLAAAGLGVRALVRAGRNAGNSAEMRTFVNPQEQTNKEKNMLTVDVKGCASFVDGAKYDAFVKKALAAWDVLDAETGAGNDFLGW